MDFQPGLGRMKPHNILFQDTFSAGFYYRLSDEDKNKAERMQESASITTQRAMIQYAVESGMIKGVRFYKEYYDDDYTGLNFDRPAFKEMMEDIKEKRIDCVIVKDFSRFGRNSDMVKKFLEREFEKKGEEIRFIAIGDNYDSLYKTPDMGVRMLLFMNEEYSQNQHLKVSLAIKTKQARGDFIGAFARYGYQKDPEDKNHLIPDPYAFFVVKRIFSLAYHENMGNTEIARLLTCEGISPPSVYKEKQGYNYHSSRIGPIAVWNPDTVDQILKDQTYTGAVVQGKKRKETLLGKSKRMAKEDYIVVEGKHEAAVAKEVFEELQKRRRSPGCRVTRNRGMFQGILRCGDCGHAMIKRSETYISRRTGERTVYTSYCCRIHKRMPELCFSNHIGEQVIKEIIRRDFNQAVSSIGDLKAAVKRCQDSKGAVEYRKLAAEQIRQFRENLRQTENLLEAVQRKWLLDKIGDEEYAALTDKYKYEKEAETARIQALQDGLKKAGDVFFSPWIQKLLKSGQITELTREVVSEMVDTVYVFHDRRIQIVYKFSETGETESDLLPEDQVFT